MRKTLEIAFHGAAKTVTGSCMELTDGSSRILIDCGLFQGPRSLERLNSEPFPFDVKAIDGVILTHAHIDHSGLLPKLIANGYDGRIWCTPPTRDLLHHMLPWSGPRRRNGMTRKHRPEEIIGKLPEEKIVLARRGTVADAHRRIGVTEQSYYRWRKDPGIPPNR